MAEVYLGLGSNMAPERNIASALDALASRFGSLELSPVYESEAVGFSGKNFLNMVVRLHTHLAVGELLTSLREIENDHGRDRNAPKFSGRTLDIDILDYDGLSGEHDGVSLPRDEILTNAFVLKPLADLAADWRHPVTAKTAAELWRAYDKSQQRLWSVDFYWRKRLVPAVASEAQ